MTEDTIRKLQQSGRVTIEKGLSFPGIKIALCLMDENKIATDFKFKEVSPSKVILPSDQINLPNKLAQQMMDELWRAGIRPSGELNSIGHREALESHLYDMRKIVSAELAVDLD